ncbi:hypothetical protein EC604_01405 [Paenibacillus amylolyticus]|uniref:Bacteriophage SP-beta YorD domain-containing protein n=1 Tax=Paenibacillus amylolyticus TaxID=1451 RepID=A0A5M9WLS0_PAEAM|nr:hypothetical protein [Paenibacillus amylolyticus]KAA8782505.1 hypothetical protein EC604_01405 [Paenibacillus amylolyticus]
MKAVPKVNIDGLYLEDELVDDAFSGVVPFYAEPEPVVFDPDQAEQPEAPEEEVEPEITGYLVGVPVPAGLFRPRFDLVVWETYQDAVKEGTQETFPDLWIEGMSQEEIDELTNPHPEEPSELDLLKQRLAESEAENKRLAEESNANQLALMELHMLVLSVVSPDEG